MAHTYYLRNKANGKVATVALKQGEIELSERRNGLWQHWVLKDPDQDGYYRIRNPKTAKVMGNGKSREAGTKIKPANAVKTSAGGQLWRMENAGRGYKRFVNKLSGQALCIAPGTGDNDGQPLCQMPYEPKGRFHWFLVPANNDYTFAVYLEQNGKAKIAIDIGDIDVSDYEKLDLLPDWAGLPAPPDTGDAALKVVVLLATAAAAVAGTVATVASGGTAAPIALSVVAGVASLGGNTAWLFWETDGNATWDALEKVYYRTSTLLTQDLRASLNGPAKYLANHGPSIERAIEMVHSRQADKDIHDEVDAAYDHLNNLDLELTTAREKLTFINSPGAKPDLWARYDGYGALHPDPLVQPWLAYLLLHARVLLAMCELSDQYTGRATGQSPPELGAVMRSFLRDSRKALVMIIRDRQQKEIEACTMSYTPASGRTNPRAYYSVYQQKERVGTHYSLEEAESALHAARKAAAAKVYATDRALQLLFNSVLRALTSMGIELKNGKGKVVKVAPISDEDAIFADHQY